MSEMDMDIRLDPIHNKWCILAPVDHGMTEVENENGKAIFRNTNGELILHYKGPDANPGIKGNLEMYWKQSNGHYPGHTTTCHFGFTTDIIEVSEMANQFLAQLGGQKILD